MGIQLKSERGTGRDLAAGRGARPREERARRRRRSASSCISAAHSPLHRDRLCNDAIHFPTANTRGEKMVLDNLRTPGIWQGWRAGRSGSAVREASTRVGWEVVKSTSGQMEAHTLWIRAQPPDQHLRTCTVALRTEGVKTQHKKHRETTTRASPARNEARLVYAKCVMMLRQLRRWRWGLRLRVQELGLADMERPEARGLREDAREASDAMPGASTCLLPLALQLPIIDDNHKSVDNNHDHY